MTLRIVEDLVKFHQAGGVPILDQPQIPPPSRAKLRGSLIAEEVNETLSAMTHQDLTEIADGIVDSIVVLVGTALEYGIDLVPIWHAVQASNMAKFPECGDCGGTGTIEGPRCLACDGRGTQLILRDDGKILKPAGWTPPDIAELIRVQQSG